METISDSELWNIVNEFKKLPNFDRYPLPKMFYDRKEFGFKLTAPPLDVIAHEVTNKEFNLVIPKVDDNVINDIKNIYTITEQPLLENENLSVAELDVSDDQHHKDK